MAAEEELDDLFGAFDEVGDGDHDGEVDNDEQQHEKESMAITSSNNKRGETDTGSTHHHQRQDRTTKTSTSSKEDVDMTDASGTPASSSAIGGGGANFTQLMNSPTATELSQKKKKGYKVTDKVETKEQQGAAAAESSKSKVIATGTSHDKSVRSYSAYPKHRLPKTTTSTDNNDNSNKLGEKLPPAKIYPFTLDPFQQAAVNFIDQSESVLVAAHTSAGKTAVAEYAIATALRNHQRVIYTSPIKALSNQKFRDLQAEFHTVGLMTGDMTINPEATVLVMTTEILRSMLYRGSELMKQVAWVIYDEVHYMRDAERGVVWEESIILLPHSVRFVFLSATIPNAEQFADWIATIHHQPCHVVYTNYRPVPLQHYIYPNGSSGIHLVVDEKGQFRESNFQRAMGMLASGANDMDGASATAMLSSGNGKRVGGGNARKRKRGSSGNAAGTGFFSIVKLIMSRNLNPVIVFSFSKKDCESFALKLQDDDYSDDIEKDLISQVYHNAIEALSEDDRNLPQVVALLPLLKRGIGIHHGGLLPILKEIVEILFSEGLIKVLFATETFAIGINMPAKTVVFTNTRKWDGRDFRWLTSGEYIQMSGRAGRRGKDDRGIVIQMVDEKMEPSVCKSILYGDPDPLNSSYRISYNMLLNMMRVEEVDAEYLLRASFHQFQRERDVPGLLQQAKDLEEQAAVLEVVEPATIIPITAEDDKDATTSLEEQERRRTNELQWIAQYAQLQHQLAVTQRKMKLQIQNPKYMTRFLQNGQGRFLEISLEGESYGWGALASYKVLTSTSGEDACKNNTKSSLAESISVRRLEVLLFCVDRRFDEDQDDATTTSHDKKVRAEDWENSSLLWRGSPSDCRPVQLGLDDPKLISLRVFTVGLDAIERISAVKIEIRGDFRSKEVRKSVGYMIREVQKRFPEGVPLLDPKRDMKITDKSFDGLLERAGELSKRMEEHEFMTKIAKDGRTAKLDTFLQKEDLLKQAKVIRDEARSCETIALKDDLKRMKKVLRRLGHVDANGVIETKGRTACEINTSNELVVVELIFTGVFNDLEVEQCMALLSCMTFDTGGSNEEKVMESMNKLKGFLKKPFLTLQRVARSVAQAVIACKIELDEDDFVFQFNPGMMEAVFAWCKGAKFVTVQELTNSYEGTTIRTLRRLEELVRQISQAAKAIGNKELESKFERGSELLKRDIVFCSSLYL